MKAHPWLIDYTVKNDTKYLIVGTHPPMPYCGKLKFYYGNMNKFWSLLNKVYPNENIFDENKCADIQNILKFLDKYRISITDMVYKTNGESFSIDKNMKVIELNPYLKEWIEIGSINTIYFTSKDYKNSAFSLFKKWFRETYGNPLRPIDKTGNEYIINDKVVKLIKLYSPSPTARRGIAGSNKYKDWLDGREHNKDLLDQFIIVSYSKELPSQMQNIEL